MVPLSFQDFFQSRRICSLLFMHVEIGPVLFSLVRHFENVGTEAFPRLLLLHGALVRTTLLVVICDRGKLRADQLVELR